MAAIFLFCSAAGPAWQAAPEQLFREALEAQQKGQDALAVQKYEALVTLRPDVPEVHANLGAVLARLGRFDAAIRHYRTALTLAPANQALQFNLALAYYKRSSFREAIQLLRPLADRAPGDGRPMEPVCRAAFRAGAGEWQRLPGPLDASILSDEAAARGRVNFTGAFVGVCCQDVAGTRRFRLLRVTGARVSSRSV